MLFYVSSNFLRELKYCTKNVEEMGPMFRRNEQKFYMYADFARMKRYSDYIAKQYQIYFHKIQTKLEYSTNVSIKPNISAND